MGKYWWKYILFVCLSAAEHLKGLQYTEAGKPLGKMLVMANVILFPISPQVCKPTPFHFTFDIFHNALVVKDVSSKSQINMREWEKII